jgi:ABC-type glycerol-3-phosphate transport system substrate-binding protein
MEEKKFTTRRGFLKLAAITGSGLALAACAPKAPAPEAPAAQEPAAAPATEAPVAPAEPAAAEKTVRLWVAWGNMNDAFQNEVWYALPEYDEICPGIKIEYKGNTGDAPVTTAIAAGDPPEAASNISYAQLAIKNVFLDCQPLVDTSKWVKESDFLQPVWDFCKFWSFNGLLGIPAFESFLCYGLNYNKEMVEKAGLDPNTPPTTFGEAFAWHEALTVKDAAGNLVQFGLDPYDAMAGDPDGLQVASGGVLWWDPATTKHNFVNDAYEEYFAVTKKFFDVMGPDQIAGLRQGEGMGGWGGSFNAEVQAMIIEGYWHPGETTVQAPEVAKKNVATWAPQIDSAKGKTVQESGGHTFAIFKDSKEPQAAFQLAEFFAQDSALDVLFKQIGWIVGKKSFLEKVDTNAYPGLQWYFDNADKASVNISLRRSPLHGFVWGQIPEVREMMYRGQITPAQACEELQKRADTEWKNQGLPVA